jgi:hypothetical protein
MVELPARFISHKEKAVNKSAGMYKIASCVSIKKIFPCQLKIHLLIYHLLAKGA